MTNDAPVPARLNLFDAYACSAARRYLDSVLFHPLPQAAWEWEYYHDPERTVVCTLQQNGAITGTQTFLPVGLVINGEQNASAKSENSFVDERYRGTTVFKSLYEFGIAECRKHKTELFWGFTRLGKWMREKMGYTVHEDWIHECTLRFRLRPVAFYVKHYGFLKGIAALMLHRLAPRRPGSLLGNGAVPEGCRWTDAPLAPVDIDEHLSRVLRDEPHVRLSMNNGFLKWRVHTNPNVQYVQQLLYRNDELLAHVLVGFRDGDAFISELTAVDEDSRRAAEARLLALAAQRRVYNIVFFGNIHHRLCKQTFGFLERLGGRTVRNAGMVFCVRSEDPRYASLLNRPEAWYLNALWTEGFRM